MRGTTCSVRESGPLIPLLACAVALLAAACACKKSTGSAADAGAPTAPQPPATADVSTVPTDVGSTQVEPPPPAADGAGPQPPFRVAMAAPVSVVILAPDRAAAMVGLAFGPQGENIDGSWEPTAEDVERFFEKLPERLEADADRRGAEVAGRLRQSPAATDAPAERYRAQIVGLQVGGKRYLYGNFFCEADVPAETLQGDLVLVRDGGTCYFQVWFDMETGEYPHLSINGEG